MSRRGKPSAQCLAALKSVGKGMSITEAARKHDVARSTLYRAMARKAVTVTGLQGEK